LKTGPHQSIIARFTGAAQGEPVEETKRIEETSYLFLIFFSSLKRRTYMVGTR
jgi:hypothetical protein